MTWLEEQARAMDLNYSIAERCRQGQGARMASKRDLAEGGWLELIMDDIVMTKVETVRLPGLLHKTFDAKKVPTLLHTAYAEPQPKYFYMGLSLIRQFNKEVQKATFILLPEAHVKIWLKPMRDTAEYVIEFSP